MRVPRATYRLQLGPGLTFDDAAALVDYLDALGVSDAYTSPFLETATRGSHGYDVADHDRLRAVPGANTEYLIYQTLVGAWPVDLARLREYLLKAVHEAKTHTSWINPDVRYDEAIVAFAEALLDPTRSQAFLDDFTAFQARVAHFGALNSLAQTLIKITAPGVPDFYQGTELWDLSLVDPDNRRPVDWALRRRLLGELERALASTSDRAGFAFGLFKEKEDGRVKLYLIREALALRRARPALFAAGEYRPLEARGAL